MAELTNAEKVEKINRFQKGGYFHELTCGVDTCRSLLEAIEKDGVVLLVCNHPGCDYSQNYIPEVILAQDYDALDEQRKHWFDK